MFPIGYRKIIIVLNGLIFEQCYLRRISKNTVGTLTMFLNEILLMSHSLGIMVELLVSV